MILNKKTVIIKELLEALDEALLYVIDSKDEELINKITRTMNYAEKEIAPEINEAKRLREIFIKESRESS